MGIFGGRDPDWEDIKAEYRTVKQDIAECEHQVQAHLDLRARSETKLSGISGLA